MDDSFTCFIFMENGSGVQMRSRTLLTVSALTVLLVSLAAVSLPAWAQTQRGSGPQETAERLVDIAEIASVRVADILLKAQERGIDTTAARSLFHAGQESLDGAKVALSDGSYEDAITKAREALGKFRESLLSLREAWMELREERAASGLQSLVERMRALVERLQERLDGVSSSVPKYLVNEVKSHLNAADGHLNAAENNLKAGNIEQAVEHVKKARVDIKTAFEGGREIVGYLREGRINNAVERLTSAADRLETLLQRAADKGISVVDLQGRLSTVRGLLSSAQVEVAAGDFHGAVTDLREAASEIRSIYEDLVSRAIGG